MINLSANEKYYEKIDTIKGQLWNIGELLDNHDTKSGAHKHWGHVGDLEKVATDLTEITKFLGWAK